ncbi:MAG: hypothetical protein J1F36_05355 [Clostridiales bacterium]|nr:hypothetical protein [Clostridiales bacterium]
MTKNSKIAILVVVIMSLFIDIGFAVMCIIMDYFIPWWVYLIIPTFAAIMLVSAFLFEKLSKKKFFKFLEKHNFCIQKQYGEIISDDPELICIDFGSKRFASNQLLSKIVPFSDIMSGNIEVKNTNEFNIQTRKTFVSLIISVKIGNALDVFYIETLQTTISNDDYSENFEITDALIEKYPSLKDIVLLKKDVERIIEINREDGVAYDHPSDDQWDEYLEQKDYTLFWE